MMVIGQSVQYVAKAEKEGALFDQCQKLTTFPMPFIQCIENTYLEQSQNLYQSKRKQLSITEPSRCQKPVTH